MNLLRDIWDWTLREDYRTWIAHALFAFCLSFLFGAWTAMIFYLLRELEQVWTTWHLGFKQNWNDHFLDVSAAFVGAGLSTFLGAVS